MLKALSGFFSSSNPPEYSINQLISEITQRYANNEFYLADLLDKIPLKPDDYYTQVKTGAFRGLNLAQLIVMSDFCLLPADLQSKFASKDVKNPLVLYGIFKSAQAGRIATLMHIKENFFDLDFDLFAKSLPACPGQSVVRLAFYDFCQSQKDSLLWEFIDERYSAHLTIDNFRIAPKSGDDQNITSIWSAAVAHLDKKPKALKYLLNNLEHDIRWQDLIKPASSTKGGSLNIVNLALKYPKNDKNGLLIKLILNNFPLMDEPQWATRVPNIDEPSVINRLVYIWTREKDINNYFLYKNLLSNILVQYGSNIDSAMLKVEYDMFGHSLDLVNNSPDLARLFLQHTNITHASLKTKETLNLFNAKQQLFTLIEKKRTQPLKVATDDLFAQATLADELGFVGSFDVLRAVFEQHQDNANSQKALNKQRVYLPGLLAQKGVYVAADQPLKDLNVTEMQELQSCEPERLN